MTVHLITGTKGEAHISSADQGSFNAGVIGEGEYVIERGNQMSASTTSNNNVRIMDGDILMQGRHIRIPNGSYEDVTITTGTVGKNRIDKIVMTYEIDDDTSIETAHIDVIKGTESSGTPTVPAHTTGDLYDGAIKNQMPLYTVQLTGVNISTPVKAFSTVACINSFDERISSNASNIATNTSNISILATKSAATTDYVLTQGASNPSTGINWSWRKWNSGKLETWLKIDNVNGTTPTAFMGGYVSSVALTPTFPWTVDSGNVAVGSGKLGSGVGFCNPVLLTTGSLTVYVGGNQNSKLISAQVYIAAKWK